MSWPSPQFERIPLAAAAALVLVRVAGARALDPQSPETARTLNAVARALSSLTQVYAGEPLEMAKELSPVELLGGDFDAGAQVFRMRDGREFRSLGIERQDLLVAVRVLQAAKARF